MEVTAGRPVKWTWRLAPERWFRRFLHHRLRHGGDKRFCIGMRGPLEDGSLRSKLDNTAEIYPCTPDGAWLERI
jgi:hypothetical protein